MNDKKKIKCKKITIYINSTHNVPGITKIHNQKYWNNQSHLFK